MFCMLYNIQRKAIIFDMSGFALLLYTCKKIFILTIDSEQNVIHTHTHTRIWPTT